MSEGRLVLRWEPLGPLFFRDGRPFDRSRSMWPLPQTVAGALRTAMLERTGCDFSALKRAMAAGKDFASALKEPGQAPGVAEVGDVRFEGPWPVVDGEVLAPAPADLFRVEDSSIVRKRPLKETLPGWQPSFPGGLPLWHRSRSKLEAVKGWIRPEGLRAWSQGRVPETGHLFGDAEIWGLEERTGIGVDPRSQAVSEGNIYGIGWMRLKPGFGFHVEMTGPRGALELVADGSALAFGGEGGRVLACRTVERAWTSAELSGGDLVCALLLTPSVLAQGWRPDLEGLRGAAVGPGLGFSGWDLARGGPKPSRWAAPAGSVFYFDTSTAVPETLAVSDEDAALGWGATLLGVGTYA